MCARMPVCVFVSVYECVCAQVCVCVPVYACLSVCVCVNMCNSKGETDEERGMEVVCEGTLKKDMRKIKEKRNLTGEVIEIDTKYHPLL